MFEKFFKQLFKNKTTVLPSYVRRLEKSFKSKDWKTFFLLWETEVIQNSLKEENKELYNIMSNHYKIKDSIENKKADTFKKLFKLNKDLSIFKEDYLLQAIDIGSVEIMEVFLSDSRFDINFANSYALRHSYYNENINVTKLLLKDKRVDPLVMYNHLIIDAFEKEKLDFVELFFENKKVKNLLIKQDKKLYEEIQQKITEYKILNNVGGL